VEKVTCRHLVLRRSMPDRLPTDTSRMIHRSLTTPYYLKFFTNFCSPAFWSRLRQIAGKTRQAWISALSRRRGRPRTALGW